MKSLKKLLIINLFLLISLSACAPNLGGSDYSTAGVGEISTTLKGVIVATRVVKIRPDNSEKSGTGAAGGMLGGALLGSTLGGGRKTPIATGVLGGIAGAVAGHALERKLTEQDGIEYQVKLTDGNIVTIAQGLEPKMSVGQKVLLIESNRYKGRSRIIPDNT